MLRVVLMALCLTCLTACTGGDFDLEKFTKIEAKTPLVDDGETYFYYGGQVTRPVPPAIITTADSVELSFIAIFRTGPSATVPPKLNWHLQGASDLSLPDVSGAANLTYVEPLPTPPIAPQLWCIFNNCLAMFTEAEYIAGDFYYAVITVDVGALPEGTHIFEMLLDEDNLYTPADVIPDIFKRSTVSVTVVPALMAKND